MRRLALLVALAGVAASTTARAQSMATVGTPAAAVNGPGVALGERMVLHVGVAAQLRYNSNVFYESSNPTQAMMLRLTPNFLLSTRNDKRDAAPHKLDFQIGAGLTYNEYLVASQGAHPPRQFNVTANAAATILPAGPVTLDLYDNYTRASMPQYQKSTYNYTQDINQLGFRLRIKPGGGRLEAQLGYAFGLNLWETSGQQPYDNFYHNSNLRLLYKFLPKTSVYVQANDIAYLYRHTNETAAYNRPNGFPLRITAGLNGLLTSKLTFDIYGGYVNGFYSYGPSPNTGIAGLSLTWKPLSLTTLSLGYKHDVLNALLGVYANYDNIYASWTQQIWRFYAFLRVAYQNTRYEGIAPSTGVTNSAGMLSTTRTDNQFVLNARVDFFTYKSWLALSLGYDFNILRTDSHLLPGTVVPGALVPVNFVKHDVYVSVSLRY